MSQVPPDEVGAIERGVAESAAAALEYLAGLLRSKADLDRVLDGYLETRRLLSRTFKVLVERRLGSPTSIMKSARDRVAAVMRSQYGTVVPEDLLRVRPYGELHTLLLAYMHSFAGKAVPGTKLRIISGDQVHTERRLRELRDLGFHIQASVVAGEHQYVLVTTEQDLDDAARVQLRHNIKGSRALSASQKKQLLEILRDP